MSASLRVVHYVNQFFAGHRRRGPGQRRCLRADRRRSGPAARSQPRSATARASSATIICGDNFASRPTRRTAVAAIGAELDRLQPDVLVAGPAFGSGRYGLACAAGVPRRAACGASPRSPPCIPTTPAVEASRQRRPASSPPRSRRQPCSPRSRRSRRFARRLGARRRSSGPRRSKATSPQGVRRVLRPRPPGLSAGARHAARQAPRPAVRDGGALRTPPSG